jgi:hypothetical protein
MKIAAAVICVILQPHRAKIFIRRKRASIARLLRAS